MTDELRLPVWLIPQTGELDKLIKKGIRIPSGIKATQDPTTGIKTPSSVMRMPPIPDIHAKYGGKIGGVDTDKLFQLLGRGQGKTTDTQIKSEEKKRRLEASTAEKEEKKSSKMVLGVLIGIGYTLAKVPSILGGVLKMLGIGFLLILKPFADLLAMILMPIARLVIDFAIWLNKLAGSGPAGMLIAAVIGLIVASIALLSIAVAGGVISAALTAFITKTIASLTLTLAGAKIATALTTLMTATIGATTLVGLLGTVLIAGAITALVVKALGGTDEDAIAAGLITVFVAGIAVIFGAPFWAALAVGILAGTLAFFGGEALQKELEKAREIYDKGLYGSTGKPDEMSINPFKGTVGVDGVAALGGPISGGGSYIVGEEGPELFTPSGSGNITPNHQLGGGQSVNISVNGIMDERKIEDMIKSVLARTMQTGNIRSW